MYDAGEGGSPTDITSVDSLSARLLRTDDHVDSLSARLSRSDAEVARLDPLNADETMARLPSMNETGDVASLQAAATTLSEKVLSGSVPLDKNAARAALRDLGMVAASLRRHGEDIAPGSSLEKALSQLSAIAAEVPRDTVYSYGPRNPDGVRRRAFTESPHEQAFIDSFTAGMEGLLHSVDSLTQATALSPDDPACAEGIHAAEKQFAAMIAAIVQVYRGPNAIPPEAFTNELRPYFDPLTVDGKPYLAPGGSQMPILLIDSALIIPLAEKSGNPAYKGYFEENVQYCPPELRAIAEHMNTMPSFVDTLVDQYDPSNPNHEAARKAALALVNALYSFRMPHLRVAEANFKLREEGKVGSGGYDPGILRTLMSYVEGARNKLKALEVKTS